MRKEENTNGYLSNEGYSVLASVTDALIYNYDVLTGDLFWEGNVYGITGFQQKEFCKTISQWEQIIHPEDRKEATGVLNKCMKEHSKYSIQYRMKIKSGEYIFVEDSGKFVYDSSGKAVRMFGIMKDITEKKTAEIALSEKISIIRSLNNNLQSAMIYQANILRGGKKQFTYFSDTVKKFYGVSAEDAIKNPALIYKRFYKEDLPDLIKAESKAIKTFTPFRHEARVLDPSGKIRWSYFVSTPRKLEDGSYCFDGIEFDITERKKAEDELRNSEARFHSYFNLPLNGVAITSPEKGWIDANEKVCSILGYSLKELRNLTWAQITYPEDLAADEKQFNRLLAGKIESYSLEKRFIRKDKKIIWTNISVGCVRKNDGKVDYIVVTIQDIAEKKKADEELKANEKKFKSIFNNSPIGMYLYKLNENKELIFTEANSSADKIVGMAHKKFIGKTITQAFPGLLKTNIPSEYKKVLFTGKEWHGSQVDYNSGEISGVYDVFAFRISENTIVVAFTDITEERKIQEELKKAKEHVELQVADRTRELNRQKVFFSSILENVPDMIFVKDANDLKFQLFNKAGESLLGYNRSDLLGKSDYDFFPKDQADFFIKKDRAVLRNGKLIDIPEEPINTKYGKKLLHTKKIPLVTEEGDKYLLGISEDITEKRRNETEYQVVMDTMSDGFYVVTSDGNFLSVNNSYCHMTGYTRDELLGKNISFVEALQSQKEIKKYISEIMIVGSGRFETKHKCKDGSLLDVEVSVTYSESSKKFFSFVRDITQRKRNEREIVARAAELEKFNKIAIGRELKMVELKKKIKKLEEERSK